MHRAWRAGRSDQAGKLSRGTDEVHNTERAVAWTEGHCQGARSRAELGMRVRVRVAPLPSRILAVALAGGV